MLQPRAVRHLLQPMHTPPGPPAPVETTPQRAFARGDRQLENATTAPRPPLFVFEDWQAPASSPANPPPPAPPPAPSSEPQQICDAAAAGPVAAVDAAAVAAAAVPAAAVPPSSPSEADELRAHASALEAALEVRRLGTIAHTPLMRPRSLAPSKLRATALPAGGREARRAARPSEAETARAGAAAAGGTGISHRSAYRAAGCHGGGGGSDGGGGGGGGGDDDDDGGGRVQPASGPGGAPGGHGDHAERTPRAPGARGGRARGARTSGGACSGRRTGTRRCLVRARSLGSAARWCSRVQAGGGRERAVRPAALARRPGALVGVVWLRVRRRPRRRRGSVPGRDGEARLRHRRADDALGGGQWEQERRQPQRQRRVPSHARKRRAGGRLALARGAARPRRRTRSPPPAPAAPRPDPHWPRTAPS